MLKGKRVLVVGGGTGIGYAVAQKAAGAGAEVIIASRSLQKLQAVAAGVGIHVRAERMDVSDEQSVIAALGRIGHVDHVVATIKPSLPSGSLLENEEAGVHAAFEAKFWGQYRLLRHAAQYVRPSGSITLTSGIASCRSYPGYSAASAMNAATEAIAKAAAVELTPVRVNVVCPGFVNSAHPNLERTKDVRGLAPNLPLNRLGEAEEIAQAYLYLMSNTYSTGTVVVVDGGAIC